MKININPEIDIKSAKHFLAIYHDVALKLNRTEEKLIKDISTGHFYIGLITEEDASSYGFNPTSLIDVFGGLFVKAGLDHMHPRDAYVLYGMLLDCKRALEVKPEVKDRWANLGKELLIGESV